MPLTDDSIATAARRLERFAPPTPLVRAPLLSDELESDIWVKNETVSPIASFKWRGALNAVLEAMEEGTRGVVTSSTGNHGQGVAWAAAVSGVPAHIFLPRNANPTKRRKIELLGAAIHEHGEDLDEAKVVAIDFAREHDLAFVDDGESAAVIAGAGTIGLEIAQQLQKIDIVFAPMGSGSLASGIAIGVKARHANAGVIAVSSDGSPAMAESFHARTAIERPAFTIADGLICRVPADLALRALIGTVDDAVVVTDDDLLAATRLMMTGAHLLVEPSGAAALAGALRFRDALRGRTVVLIATGANITPELLRRAVL